MKCLDLFGEPVKILINKKDTVKTSMGGYLTIVMIAIIGIVAWQVGRDLFEKQKPFSFQQISISTTTPKLNITPKEFPFAIQITDWIGVPFYDERYFSLKVSYVVGVLNSTTSAFDYVETPIELAYCNYTDWSIFSDDMIENYALTQKFCPINKQVDLAGFWNEEEIRYIAVQLFMCDYETTPDYCVSKQEIEDLNAERTFYLSVDIADHYVDSKNYTTPIQIYPNSFYKMIDTDKLKNIDYLISRNQVNTDKGFLFSDNQPEYYFKMTERSVDSTKIDRVTKYLMHVGIYASNKSEIIYRTYIKLGDVVASVGGIMKIFTLVFYYLNLFFARIEKLSYMIDIVYNYNLNPEEEGLKSKTELVNLKTERNTSIKVSQINIRSNMNILNISNQIGNINNNIQPDEIYKKIVLDRKGEKLKFSMKNNFNLIFNCKSKNELENRKIRMYNKGVSQINSYFDLTYIIQKLYELENLKKIIFANHQLTLFNCLKPKLDIDKDEIITCIDVKDAINQLCNNATRIPMIGENNSVDQSMLKLILS